MDAIFAKIAEETTNFGLGVDEVSLHTYLPSTQMRGRPPACLDWCESH